VIVYLDLNKWIELARIINGKNVSARSSHILEEYLAAKASGYIFPLSSMHYIEFSRISNIGRRKRLGKVMWDFSQGYSLASYSNIIDWEIEVAFSKYNPTMKLSKLKLISHGIDHAFGTNIFQHLPKNTTEQINRTMLTGDENVAVEPLLSKHIDNAPSHFFNHLNELKNRKNCLDGTPIENWLYALSMKDIIGPINRVLNKHKITSSFLSDLPIKEHFKLMDSIPTRKLDIHLHRQILKNSNYHPKITDLGDWGGIGIASCYCDVVICEKHFADLLQRDHYNSHARIETNLENLIQPISSKITSPSMGKNKNAQRQKGRNMSSNKQTTNRQ
jgi:hypothetical protein